MKLTENQRLKILRQHLNMTQSQFGMIVNLKQGSYADVERGKVNVSGDIKNALFKEFSINVNWLETGDGNMFLEDAVREKIKIDGIPMFNFPGSASNVEMYGDPTDVKIIGYLNIPGATKSSFALPVHGNSMYPTLENGSWCVLRPIEDRQDIQWGEIYYIEYGDYRVFKRLLASDNEDSVILWSDNQSETIGSRPKYAPKTIKTERIKKLCLLTDILKKPNY
ncbi:LexA family transcriptional regulator [Mucilaginibacter sabulilitoris]|uniref:LexA family transcriptional regulator n=1 Tax=Mucilaginibacter sabulilitoris TaxID=1173583 RepID=A0ABZ0THH7_9SPHI|nr:LexA family transcriptional regulator [Mucilaginibacter sabulilitoris]WPU91852.1 LexA family transcriptional regulator [Mucilaginibacter sabulilitoris]